MDGTGNSYLCGMTMRKLRITAVEYLNTALFVQGLKDISSNDWFSLSLDHPADCARKIKSGEADIGLVPVASIPDLNPKFIFGDHCIGANGPVRTVRLYARRPYFEINNIVLDPHSRTSVQLLRILYQQFWKKEMLYQEAMNGFELHSYPEDTGLLVIGDKAFALEDSYPYAYDLAEEWIKHTQKHFVFAAWISMLELDSAEIQFVKDALRLGLDRRSEIISNWIDEGRYHGIDIRSYLTENISYEFDGHKRSGLELFLRLSGGSDYVAKYK